MIPEIQMTGGTPVPMGARQARDGLHQCQQGLFGVLLSLFQMQDCSFFEASLQRGDQTAMPDTQHDVSMAQSVDSPRESRTICFSTKSSQEGFRQSADSLPESRTIEVLSWAKPDEPQLTPSHTLRPPSREIENTEGVDIQPFMIDPEADIPWNRPSTEFELRATADPGFPEIFRATDKIQMAPNAQSTMDVVARQEMSQEMSMEAGPKIDLNGEELQAVAREETSSTDGTDLPLEGLDEDRPTAARVGGAESEEPLPRHLVSVNARLQSTATSLESEVSAKSDLQSMDFTRAREIAATLYRESLKNLPKSLEFRLDPPELGKVTVLLTTRGEEVAVKFVVSTPGAGRVIAEATPDLSRALSEQGLFLAGTVVDNGSADSGARPEEQRFQREGGKKAGTIKNVSRALEPSVFIVSGRSSLDYLA